jgi:uncharacterized protein
MRCYLDTSALAKWYLPELGAVEFERFLQRRGGGDVSSLGVLELRCTFARRRRAREITTGTEQAVLSAFREDLTSGVLGVHPLTDQDVGNATRLLDQTASIALRSLDALHLAVADRIGALELATADRIMRQAARHLGMKVHFFGQPKAKANR